MDFVKDYLPSLYNIDSFYSLYKKYKGVELIDYSNKLSAVYSDKGKLSTIEAGPFGVYNTNNFNVEYFNYLKMISCSKIIFSDVGNILNNKNLFAIASDVEIYWLEVDDFEKMALKFNRNRRRSFKKLFEQLDYFSIKNGNIDDLLYIFSLEKQRKNINDFSDEFIKELLQINENGYNFYDFEIYYKNSVVGAFIYFEFRDVLVEFMAYFDKSVTDLSSDYARYYLLDLAYKKEMKYYCFGLTPIDFNGVDRYKKGFRPNKYEFKIYTIFRNRFIYYMYKLKSWKKK